MIWPFAKQKANPQPRQPARIYYKSGPAFFESQCQFGHTAIEVGVAVVGLVLDAEKEFGTSPSVLIGKDGCQLAALKIASEDGGFLVFASTPSPAGERLKPDDVVLWVPSIYVEQAGSKMSDKRSGWVGLIRAKIKPEVDPHDPSFIVACHYR